MSGNRILVTGATGFIGRHLVEQFLGKDRPLLLVVRDLRHCPAHWLSRPDVKIAEVPDLASPADLSHLTQEVDTVVHLAGLAHVAASDRAGDESGFMRANARATQALSDAARTSNVRTFVHLSSLASVTANATNETVDDRTNEAPATAYGQSKRAAEGYVRRLAEAGILAISLRPPLVVGAEARGNWASLQALAATGLPLPFASIRNRRSFVGIRTLTEAITILSDGNWPSSRSGDYCIADAAPLSLPEVIGELRAGMGMPTRLLPCPPSLFDLLGKAAGRRRQIAGLTGNLVVDPSRFGDTFGLRPTQEIRQAIRQSGKDFLRLRGVS